MKKFIAMLCMLTCIMGLTGCGSETELSVVEQSRAATAQEVAAGFIVPYMMEFFDDEIAEQYISNFNVHDLEYIVENELNSVLYMLTNNYGMSIGVDSIDVDGNAVLNGIASYNGTYKSLGEVDKNMPMEPAYRFSNNKDSIIVTVQLTGSEKDKKGNLRTAEAEVILSNDVFLTVEGISLNLNQSTGELMGKAGMDTLMGMCVVFAILILISFIIAALGMLPKLQEKMSRKKAEKKTAKAEAVDNTIAQIIEKEESLEGDNLELIAVIAAAIAASEGQTSTDGFVVRSIIRRR